MRALTKNRKSRPRAWKGSFQKSHFAPAFFFLETRRRKGLETLYAVCRILDDAVDQPFEEPQLFLEAWRQVFETKNPSHVAMFGYEGLAKEFLSVAREFDLDLYPMVDLIDRGVSLDLNPERFKTVMDTEAYCYGVAGTVGLSCLPIFGVPPAEAKEYAIRLGIAIQWVNAIRDIQSDLEIGRFYFPQDHLEEIALPEGQFLLKENREKARLFLAREAAVARSYFERADDLLPDRWRRELLPARIMGRIYRNLLVKLEQKDFPVFGKKVKLGLLGKISSVLREMRA